MKVSLPLILLFSASWLLAGAAGSFAGTVVDGPENAGGWIYVQGRNHSVRRVNVSRAKIRYDSEVPKAERSSPVPKALAAGTRVRITAEQDESGEWQANDIEILKAGGGDDEKKDSEPTTSPT